MRIPTPHDTAVSIRRVQLMCALAAGLVLCVSHPAAAQPQVQGQWRMTPWTMPINPIHLTLLHTGKVLIVAGSGNVPTEHVFTGGVWDPQTGDISVQTLGWDMFCNAMVALEDGRVFINGGNLAYDPFLGEPRNAIYDPATDTFTDVENMAHGRWYPTTTMLGDGRIMTFSGLLETGGTNKAVEIYDPATGWSPEYFAGWTPPLYPRQHLLPDGTVIYTGSSRPTRTFNPTTHKWSSHLASTNYTGTRKYGTSVLLPLSPADGYKARIIIMGGGNPATKTTEILDTSVTPLQWVYGPPMSQPRIEMNATILPNGKVLALGGSLNDEDVTTASLNADLYDPVTNTFSSAGANAVPRLYHSASLLLPDATVVFMGGNPQRGKYDKTIEIYTPAYLFDESGHPAVRPSIADLPAHVSYGDSFQIATPDAADIASIALVRPGSPTHAFDMDQRLINLSFTAGTGSVTAVAPPNGNIAPPGYYMVFLLNSKGVPSVARFVHLSTPPVNRAPVATIATPASDIAIVAGQSVDFAGSGSDSDGTVTSYAWTFPGGSPATSDQAVPGSVRYATGGTYVASLTATDDDGAVSAARTRTVTVQDFSLTAGTSSITLDPGGSGTVSVDVGSVASFGGTVTLSVAGMPAGVTAILGDSSVVAPGSTILTVTAAAGAVPGAYPLTITATSAGLTRQATVTVAIAGDFAVSITPDVQTIVKTAKAKYTVKVTSATTDPVTLGVVGLPRLAPGHFNKTTLNGSGTATLTISTKKNLELGSYVFTVTATSGGATRSVTATLVVQ